MNCNAKIITDALEFKTLSNINTFQNSFLRSFIENFEQHSPTHDMAFFILYQTWEIIQNEWVVKRLLSWVHKMYSWLYLTAEKFSHTLSAAPGGRSWWSPWSGSAVRCVAMGCNLLGVERSLCLQEDSFFLLQGCQWGWNFTSQTRL